MISFFKNRSKRTANAKIGKEISNNIGRIAMQIAKGKRNEEETRRWVVDMVRSAFGYKDNEIETELTVLGKRVDIALLDNQRVIAVIECKAATVQLNEAAVNQVSNYTAALDAEWGILTNGNRWILFHVIPRKGREPEINQLFDIEVLDDDGLSKDDINSLYLLTKQAILSGETKMAYHEGFILSGDNIKEAISSPEILANIAEKLKSSYKSKHGVSIDPDKELLRELIELAIDDFDNSL